MNQPDILTHTTYSILVQINLKCVSFIFVVQVVSVQSTHILINQVLSPKKDDILYLTKSQLKYFILSECNK